MTTKTETIRLKSGAALLVEKRVIDDTIEVVFRLPEKQKLLLHWGLCADGCASWTIPPGPVRPEGTKAFDAKAVQTPFEDMDGEGRIVIRLDKASDISSVSFVIFSPEENSWDNNNGRNYTVRLPGREVFPELPDLSDMAEEIIRSETGRNSWSLMHRFNLCHDLAERVRDNVEGLALLFVWLRFSAIRQLDWQRNYNTQPRELSHSQDRLTMKLAEIFINEPASRELVRLMMTAVGRGGEGQRIRDEILNIMHRHHIKEVSGHFMEEWHQKIHNNTTPDDIVICEAYLAFLRSYGNLDSFYNTLRAGGVTKERLAGFERPITTPPDFVPHIRDGLLHDFEHYLRILKSVHSGTDLETAVHSARYLFDGGMNDLFTFILHHRHEGAMPVADLAQKITAARRAINNVLNNERDRGRVRDALFLDNAMDEFLGTAVGRSLHSGMDKNLLVDLTGTVLENVRFSSDNLDFSSCFRHWEKLGRLPRFGEDWSLHSKSVLDRTGRGVGEFSDRYYRLFQSKAASLGRAFHADSWAVTIFSEEVVRGRTAFVLSMVLHHLDPVLRTSAHLGNWQVISPGKAHGRVEVADSLRSVQGKRFESPTIIVADRVMGDEEPPEGVTAVITPDTTDIVSHVAIRARNANILFATCYDRDTLDRLRSLKGHALTLTVSSAGDVIFEEGPIETNIAIPLIKPGRREIMRPVFTSYALPGKAFREGVVGAKANNLKALRSRLPDRILVPASAAIPFGVFEKTLELEPNAGAAARCRELTGRLENASAGERTEILADMRTTLLSLEPPDELSPALLGAMEEAGLKWPESWPEIWNDAWMCIKRVWASKWNERAYLSRKTRGIAHDDLFMAVLIQQVVEAEYSFVIHTVNPFTLDRDELYAETVLGLGETLVGNYPGRALGFTLKKGERRTRLVSYPNKGIGLFGGGLIFRSDSNGEDLVDYAGAGLYDSVMLDPPAERLLDYTDEPLIWDEGFREKLLNTIAETGIIAEDVFGAPQDVEGAYAGGHCCIVQTRPQI